MRWVSSSNMLNRVFRKSIIGFQRMFVFHSVAFQCVSQECCCVSLQFHKKLLVWHWCDTWAKHGMRWIIRRGQQFCGRTNTSYVSDVCGYNLHIQALVCMCKGNAETLFLFCVGKTVTLDKQDKTSNPFKNYWKCCWHSMHGGKEKSQQSCGRKAGVYSKWKNWSFIYRRDTAVGCVRNCCAEKNAIVHSSIPSTCTALQL